MIQFGHIEFFWAFLLIIVFIALYLGYIVWKKKAWQRFGDPNITGRMVILKSGSRPFLRFLFLLLALTFLIGGLIDPEVGSRLEKVKRKGIDLYIALDVSNSMLAQDIKPNRLDRAKMAISNLIDKLNGDRVGLIVFAGKAYKQLPLTTDYSAAKLFLSAVDTKIVPTQGTAIGSAINLAAASFGENDKHNKAIIVITDGENHQGDAIAAAKAAAAKGIRVFTIGMGLPGGAPIPINKNGNKTFLKNQKGKIVITRLNEKMLQEIAAAGKGAYARANNASVGLDKILQRLNKIQKHEIEEKQFTAYEHRFQYFLAVAIFFLILELLLVERKPKWTNKIDFFGK